MPAECREPCVATVCSRPGVHAPSPLPPLIGSLERLLRILERISYDVNKAVVTEQDGLPCSLGRRLCLPAQGWQVERQHRGETSIAPCGFRDLPPLLVELVAR